MWAALLSLKKKHFELTLSFFLGPYNIYKQKIITSF